MVERLEDSNFFSPTFRRHMLTHVARTKHLHRYVAIAAFAIDCMIDGARCATPNDGPHFVALRHHTKVAFKLARLAQVLKRATWDMAEYLGSEQSLGSIEARKLADFFIVDGDPTKDLGVLKQVRLVVKNGVVYAPSEIHARYGIRAFAEPLLLPTVAQPPE